MAFSQQDRVNVRHFLGFGSIFKQADLRLENALTSIQSVADGGSQPDSTSENAVRAIVADLLNVECMLKSLWGQFAVGRAASVRLDAARAMIALRMEGRRLVTGLSSVLATNPRRDAFASTAPNPDGDTFYDAPGGKGYQW
jgi:hypothetical protein